MEAKSTSDHPPRSAAENMLLDWAGGPKGFVYSTIPVVVFVTANVFLPLAVTIGAAVTVGLGLTVFRLARGERLTSAAVGLIGVVIAAGVVALTGSAKNYFVVGIWVYFAGFVLNTASVLAGRPLTWIIWNFLHGRGHSWRPVRSVRRPHVIATLAAALVLGARFVVQQWLYVADSTGGLGVARIVMGVPLSVLVVLVVVWAFRHSTRELVKKP